MTLPVCSIGGCPHTATVTGTISRTGRAPYGAPLCNGHHLRWLRTGDVQADRPLQVRRGWPDNLLRQLVFMPPTTMATGCIEWTGPPDSHGYSRVRKDGKIVKGHRAAWELVHGEPFPGGLDPDHLCGNTICVNPGHLDPVTHAENIRRGYAAKKTRIATAGTAGDLAA